jgi:hypothetical protein
VFSSRFIVLTGKVLLATVVVAGKTELSTKLIFGNGRRGWINPGPG